MPNLRTDAHLEESMHDLSIRHPGTAMVEVETSKGVAEIQASLVIAKRFPRDEQAASMKIERACQRPALAEQAVYSYTRGGQEVTGPSIRLAEAMAQAWGNIDFGWRELGRARGTDGQMESTINAFCWDKESNTRRETTFTVPHFRDTRQGRKQLNDERDVYELCANQAARRIRANVLSVIPGDIVEMAVATCRATLETNVNMSPKKVSDLLDGLARYGVSRVQVVKWLGRSIEAMTPAQFVRLMGIGTSLRDGMGRAEDFFAADESGHMETRAADKATPAPGMTPEALTAAVVAAASRQDAIALVTTNPGILGKAGARALIEKHHPKAAEKVAEVAPAETAPVAEDPKSALLAELTQKLRDGEMAESDVYEALGESGHFAPESREHGRAFHDVKTAAAGVA